MRLLVLAVVGVALGVVVRVVLGRRPGGADAVAPLRAVPSTDVRPPSSADTSRAGSGAAEEPTAEEAGSSTRPAPVTAAEEPRRAAPGLDASAGWEELTATSIGSRPDR